MVWTGVPSSEVIAGSASAISLGLRKYIGTPVQLLIVSHNGVTIFFIEYDTGFISGNVLYPDELTSLWGWNVDIDLDGDFRLVSLSDVKEDFIALTKNLHSYLSDMDESQVFLGMWCESCCLGEHSSLITDVVEVDGVCGVISYSVFEAVKELNYVKSRL